MTEETTQVYETIDMNVIKFDVTAAAIATLAKKYAGYEEKDLNDKVEFELVRVACSDLKKKRTSVEHRRKDLKADALAYGKKVDSAARDIKEKISAIEDPIAAKMKEFKEQQEIKRLEVIRLEEERIDIIVEKIASIKALPGGLIQSDSQTVAVSMTKLQAECESFLWAAEFAEKAEKAFTETISTLNELYAMKDKAEQADRLLAENEEKRKAEEAERMKDEEKRKAEEAAVLAVEQERLRKEREELDAELAKMQAERDKLESDKAKIEQEKNAAELEKKRVAAAEESKRVAAEKIKAEEEAAKLKAEENKKRNSEMVKEALADMDNVFAVSDTGDIDELLKAIINGDIRHIQWVD